jgi:hypothetical protein
MHIAVLETQSNQPYIFASNRQAAALGASQLLLESCTSWVLKACNKESDKSLTSIEARRDLLAKEKLTPDDNGLTDVSVVLATSGRSVLLSSDRESLEMAVRKVTVRCLSEAPGMGLSAGIHEFQWNDADIVSKHSVAPVWQAMREASRKAKANWMSATRPDSRFARMPILRDCDVSGYPANFLATTPDGGHEFRGTIVHHQILARDRARERIQRSLGSEAALRIATEIDDLSGSWQAVIHADSNGFGRLFGVLGEVLPTDNEACLRAYQEFSLGLESVTESALTTAIRNSAEDSGVYPIIFGGDDITLVVSGHTALKVTAEYLREFAGRASELLQRLKKNELSPGVAVVREGADLGLLPKTLSASAGVVFVKPGFPFSTAYDLADDLTNNAKSNYRRDSNSTPTSLVDFHVLYDSSDTSLDSIRERRTGLVAGPYRVGPTSGASDDSFELDDLSADADLKSFRDNRSLLRDMRAAIVKSNGLTNGAKQLLTSAKNIGRVNAEVQEGIERLIVPGKSRLADVLDLMEIRPPTQQSEAS